VDASQGVETQTVANTFLAASHNLTILLVINKIDLPAAQADFVKEQIENVLAIPAANALMTSAKSGIGVADVLARGAADPTAQSQSRQSVSSLRCLIRGPTSIAARRC